MSESTTSKFRPVVTTIIISTVGLLLLIVLYDRLTYYKSLSKGDKLDIGVEAPSFELITTKGEKVGTKELRGRAVLLFFFSADCGFCVEEAPIWHGIMSRYDSSKIEFLGITSSSIDETMKFFKQTELIFPVLLDNGQTIKRYHVSNYPEIFLIGPDGKIAFLSSNTPTDEGVRLLDSILEKIL